MSFLPVYDSAVVQPYIDGKPFDSELNPARVTFLGSTPGQITAKIFSAGLIDDEDPDSGYRWIETDHITDATVSEAGSGELMLDGTSENLMRHAGLAAEDAAIRYHIIPKGCANCR